jgi:hypothetical protein
VRRGGLGSGEASSAAAVTLLPPAGIALRIIFEPAGCD